MRRRFLLTSALADILALALSVMLVSQLLFGTAFPWQARSVGPPVFLFLAFLFGTALLSSALTTGMWGSGVPRPTYARGITIVLSTLALTSLLVLLTRSYFSRPLLAGTLVMWMVAAMAHRAWRRRRPWSEAMVIVTTEKELADDLRQAPHADVVMVLDPRTEATDPPPPGVTLVVDLRTVLSERMAQYVSSSAMAGYPVRPLTAVYEEHTGRVPLVHLAEGWEISTPLGRTTPYLPGKRVFDVTMVVVTLPLWLPAMLLAAMAVRFSSPGRVVFKQRRVGIDGRPFVLYKFRTMDVNAESNGPRFASIGDDRLTPLGRRLRRFHLDELPQFWNVIKGDLSLVGPRPEQIPFVGQFHRQIPFYSHRHMVRPGITGWAQVNYGYADDTAETIEKLAYDLYYIKHMSPVLDLQILGRSIWIVLSGSGAR